jgi:hypothetical protein
MQMHQTMNKNVFTANLSGQEEVPPVNTSTTGYITVHNFKNSQQLSYMLEVYQGEDISAAHLHCGMPNENGPVVVDLFTGSTRDVDGMLAQGMINPGDIKTVGSSCDPVINSVDDLVYAIEQGAVYANVHSVEHPNGEVRGQVNSMYYGMGGNFDLMEGIQVRQLDESPAGTQSFVITIENDVLRQISVMLHMFAEHLVSLTN